MSKKLVFRKINGGKYSGRIVLMSGSEHRNFYMVLATPTLKTEYWRSEDIGENIESEVVDIMTCKSFCTNFSTTYSALPHLKKNLKKLLNISI